VLQRKGLFFSFLLPSSSPFEPRIRLGLGSSAEQASPSGNYGTKTSSVSWLAQLFISRDIPCAVESDHRSTNPFLLPFVLLTRRELACLVVFIILIFVSEVPSGQDDHCQQDGPKSSSFVYVPVLCGHKDTSAFDLSSIRFASQIRTSQDQFRH
jgi:hypothetical protein